MHHARRGFTLIEMLVVMAIMITLAALALTLGPRFTERQRVSTGADQMQKWLLIAKQRALRDRRPSGLRFIAPTSADLDFTYTHHAKHFEYIEQPDNLVGSFLPGTDSRAALRKFGPANNLQQAVVFPQAYTIADIHAGDVIVFPELDIRRMITSYNANSRLALLSSTALITPAAEQRQQSSLTAAYGSNTANPAVSSPDRVVGYTIIRAPQPLAGEPTLTLPNGVAVDTFYVSELQSSGQNYARSNPPFGTGGGGPFDIIFAPSGQVLGTKTGRMCFWLRDITLSQDETNTFPVDLELYAGSPPSASDKARALRAVPQGDNVIVTVYTRTGAIATHPLHVDIDSSGARSVLNPFKNSSDGKGSGL